MRPLAIERPFEVDQERIWFRRWWVHLLLFLLTLVTTTVFGSALQTSSHAGTALQDSFLVESYTRLFGGDWRVWSGWVYSVPLLLILLAHEAGHYVACRRWKVDATLPYFGPSPTLLGTFGAAIWIRSPIYRRKALFDIGVWGPLSGFAILVPILFVGIWMSRIVHGMEAKGSFVFGTPLLLRAVERLRFPGAAASDICLHPVAMAAWAGLLATAINLLPIGQLDGGHILYAAFGARTHRLVSAAVISALVVAGFFYWPWWVWAVAMFFLRRHQLIYDNEQLGPKRYAVCAGALILLLVSFAIIPVQIQ